MGAPGGGVSMPITTVLATGEVDIDGLLWGTKWVSGATFSFPDAASDYNGEDSEAFNGFAPITARQQQLMRFIYDGTGPTLPGLGKAMSVADFTNLKLVFAGDGTADLRVAASGAPATAYAYYPALAGAGGDVWFGTAFAGTQYDYRNPVLGSYAYLVHLHEALHSLGLKHGHEAGGVAGQAVTAGHDSIEYTVMSYASFVGQTQPGVTYGGWDAPQTPMLLDIQALQYLYGADYGYHAGNTVYRWSPTTGELSIDGAGQGTPGGNKVFMTLWDGGGIDTYDLSNFGAGVEVDLAPGGWSTLAPGQLAYLGYENGVSHYAAGCVANAYLYEGNTASLIENAVCGSGNDTLYANQADNLLVGNAGDDAFYASAGDDTVLGGEGTDTDHLGGTWTQYRIAAAPGGGFIVTDLRGLEGTDVVSGVEWFAFADRMVASADLLPAITPPPVHVSEAQIAAYLAVADRMIDSMIAHGIWHL
jgi:serralysin